MSYSDIMNSFQQQSMIQHEEEHYQEESEAESESRSPIKRPTHLAEAGVVPD